MKSLEMWEEMVRKQIGYILCALFPRCTDLFVAVRSDEDADRSRGIKSTTKQGPYASQTDDAHPYMPCNPTLQGMRAINLLTLTPPLGPKPNAINKTRWWGPHVQECRLRRMPHPNFSRLGVDILGENGLPASVHLLIRVALNPLDAVEMVEGLENGGLLEEHVALEPPWQPGEELVPHEGASGHSED